MPLVHRRPPLVRSALPALLLPALLLSACSPTGPQDAGRATPTPSATAPSTAPTPAPPTSAPPTPTPPGTPSPSPEERSSPPAWLGTRVLPTDDPSAVAALTTPPELRERAFTLPDRLPALPGEGFRARVTTPAPASVLARSTWRRQCPVAARDLAWVRLTFRGFDGGRHTGELLVNASVADDLVRVFRTLWREEFPMEQLSITTRAEQEAEPTGDGNTTGVFDCRAVTGGASYSEHAYGRAIDLNPFQNPYVKGDVVLPELARSYLDRDWLRPGMITDDGPVVRAFARIGWGWGGSWRSLKDYQHFSANNR